MREDSERLSWNSEATLDMTTIPVMVTSFALQNHFKPWGLTLEAVPDAPPGCHPVLIDLWHVNAGRARAAGVDQHNWSESLGSTTSALAGAWLGGATSASWGGLQGALEGARRGAQLGPFGSWWGAVGGWMTGIARSGNAGVSAGAVRGAALGASVARRWSETASESLGTYDEVLISVPNVTRRGGGARRYACVLGMCTNSGIAIWGDRSMRCGYRKCGAEITRQGFHRYTVVRDGASATLSALTQTLSAAAWGPPDDRFGQYRALFAQPLLGLLASGVVAVTFLDRLLADSKVRWAPVSARLDITPGFVAGLTDFIGGLPSGTFDVPPLSGEHAWGAFQASGVVTRVTNPKHVSVGGLD
jgi:hypothetical protein